MSDLDTFECSNCGESFKAYPDANAAQAGARNPASETRYNRLRVSAPAGRQR